jgi:hypothetical protein
MMELSGLQPDSRRRSIPVHLVAWALALVAGYVLLLAITARDLELSIVAGQRMLRGEPIYYTDEGAFAYPPLLAAACVPLAVLPEPARRPAWCLINLAALAVILSGVHRRVWPLVAARAGRRIPVWAFWGLVALVSARHVSAALENPSHDLLVFLCCWLALDSFAAERSVAAGLLAGVGAALKATPLLFLLLFAWQRRGVALAWMALALIAGTLLPDLAFPSRDGTSWTTGWYRTFIVHVQPGESAASMDVWKSWNPLNQSLAGTLHRLFTPPPRVRDQPSVCVVELDHRLVKLVTLGCQLAALAGVLWITRRKRTCSLSDESRAVARVGEGAALLTAMVLLSPMSSKSHFCVLLVPAAYCLADFLSRRRGPVVGMALAAAFALGTLTAKDLLPRGVAEQLLSCGVITWTALVLFVATGRVLVQRSLASGLADLPVPPQPGRAMSALRLRQAS